MQHAQLSQQTLLLTQLPSSQELLSRLEHTVVCRLYRLAGQLGQRSGRRNADIIRQLIELRSSWCSIIRAQAELH